LHYGTVFSRTAHQRLIEDMEVVCTRRPQSHAAEWGSWKEIRFRDGERIKLRIGELQNATQLYEVMKAESVRRETASRRVPIAHVPPDHHLRHRVEPHLEVGETLYWIGIPVYRKLCSEMAAGVVLGMVLCVPGFGGLAFFLWIAIKKDEPGPYFAAAIAAIFAGIALHFLATPYWCRRWMRDTVYAITSRRALVLHGLTWGDRSIPNPAKNPVESFGIAQLRDYQLVGGGRDISLGGDWRRGGGRRRRQYHWAHRGFLAPDDPVAAENAILHLLADEPPLLANA
jgi:hypothetical protein